MLANGSAVPRDIILQAVMYCRISDRTFDKARQNLEGRVIVYHVGNMWYMRFRTDAGSKDATTQLTMNDAPLKTWVLKSQLRCSPYKVYFQIQFKPNHLNALLNPAASASATVIV